ncbi:MAG TPA: FAD-dependent oxidoreductase [Solirubrobacteraceae bacterium]|nr:FAD-dependent oxidoreductase [Solirubrobacteraceae bacterium]
MAQTSGADGIVIVGGGLAGQRCAEALRRHGYDGALRIVCAEPRRPYDRPPLSKEMLAGSCDEDSLAFKTAGWYEERSIDLLLGVHATGLDLAQRRLGVSEGRPLAYRQLVIATGSIPRGLPLLEGYENVSALRSVDDCLALREVLAGRPRLTVLGAGFIGQEVAATARSLGAQVTMIEAAPAPLASVLGRELGSWFTRLHTAEGVEVLTDCTVTDALSNGHVQALRLSNGRTVDTDHVVVGIGVRPDVGWLAGSPIASPGGIEASPAGHTVAPGVYAIGDAAATFDPVVGGHLPGSHWEAASRQAGRCACVMLGLDPGPAELTSFWTDQYGIRIQYLGHAQLADAVEIDGNPDVRNFSVTFTRAGRPVAGLLVDRARELPRLRTAIEQGET